MKQFQLDKKDLLNACREVAKSTLWQNEKPRDLSDIVDTEQIANTINAYYEEAPFHLEFITDQGRDQNLITRAVYYMARAHAIPPMKDDINWFKDTLSTLIEMACPNIVHTRNSAKFLEDVEEGIKDIRENIQE
jgi:hypothetical protein